MSWLPGGVGCAVHEVQLGRCAMAVIIYVRCGPCISMIFPRLVSTANPPGRRCSVNAHSARVDDSALPGVQSWRAWAVDPMLAGVAFRKADELGKVVPRGTSGVID